MTRPLAPLALLLLTLAGVAAGSVAVRAQEYELTPFEVIDRGLTQPLDEDGRYRVPLYGISGQDDWSSARQSTQGLSIAMDARDPWQRVACKQDRVWQLVTVTATETALQIARDASDRILSQRLECVTESRTGRVVYMSLPFAASDQQGLLALLALVLPLASYPLSRRLLGRFDTAVEQHLAGDTAPEPVAAAAVGLAPGTELRLREIAAGSSPVFVAATAALRLRLAGYALVGLSSAGVLGYAWTAGVDEPWSPVRHLALTVMCAWPLVPTLGPLAGRRGTRRALWGYAIAVAAIVLRTGPEVLIVLGFSVLGAVGLLTLFIPRTRAAHGWMLLAVACVCAGLNLPFMVLQYERNQRPFVEAAAALGLGAYTALALVVLLSAGLLACLFWVVAGAGAAGFRKLRLNSRLTALVTFWILYCVAEALMIGARSGRLLLLALCAVIPVVVAVVIAVMLTRTAKASGARVLYLRAFDEGAKSVTLLSQLEFWLSGVASIDLISGPDVASTLAQPQELLDFIARRGGRMYLKTMQAFEARRELDDPRVDADGSHPVHGYFCANAVWKQVFHRLAEGASMIVMDARGLKAPGGGVSYELAELIQRIPLERVVVITSEQEHERRVLTRVVAEAHAAQPEGSPNRALTDPTLSIFSYRDAAVDVLVRVICAALRGPESENAHRPTTKTAPANPARS